MPIVQYLRLLSDAEARWGRAAIMLDMEFAIELRTLKALAQREAQERSSDG